MSEKELTELIRDIELILMDVDGVLTDGKLSFVPNGDELVEVKSFSVQDGAGIALAHRAGLKTGWVSARGSSVVTKRATELSVEFVYLDVRDKKTALDHILAESGIPAERVCFTRRSLSSCFSSNPRRVFSSSTSHPMSRSSPSGSPWTFTPTIFRSPDSTAF